MLINLIVIISQYILYQIINLYTVDIYNVICQLYLSKAGENITLKYL